MFSSGNIYYNLFLSFRMMKIVFRKNYLFTSVHKELLNNSNATLAKFNNNYDYLIQKKASLRL